MPRSLSAIAALAFALLLPGSARAQEYLDPAFDPRVAQPAHAGKHPVVRIDQAHFNVDTIGGRFQPLADLLGHDGCKVVAGHMKFTAASLDSADVLVVSNARGAGDMRASWVAFPAFTAQECDAVREWVRGGGALLLIADQAPLGPANDILAKRFDVQMGKHLTVDPRHNDAGNPGWIRYTREDGTLADHAITRGRKQDERVNQVVAFTGQSLKGPPGSAALLVLQKPAVDLPLTPGGERTTSPEIQSDGQVVNRDRVAADGRAQGVAFTFGKGRVVVLGESSMFSANLLPDPRDTSGATKIQVGMNRPDLDNRQLALNVVRWLTGVLK